jgi:hypothetical protein
MRNIDPTASEYITSGYIQLSRPGGPLFDPVTVAMVIAGSSLAAGAMSADATSSAASTAAGSTDRATQMQFDMYNRNKADVQPWMNTGNLALSQLSSWLGLPGSGAPGTGAPGMATSGGGGSPGETMDQIRARLAPQFTTPSPQMSFGDVIHGIQAGTYNPNGTVDQPGLDAAVRNAMLGQGTGAAGMPGGAMPQAIVPTGGQAPGMGAGAGSFGALTRPFGPGDAAADPVLGMAQSQYANLGADPYLNTMNQRASTAGTNPLMDVANGQLAASANDPLMPVASSNLAATAVDPLMGVANQQLAGTASNPMMPLTLASLSGTQSDPVMAMLSKGFNFSEDPGYQFRLQQGLDAVKNQASSLGGVNSGATLKSLNDYAQGQASSEYNNSFQRWLQQLMSMGSEQNSQFGRQSTALGQTLGEYNAGFGRQATAFGQAAGEQQAQFGRQATAFGQAAGEQQAQFGRQSTAFGQAAGEQQNLFNQQQASLGQAAGEYNADFNRQNVSLANVSGAYQDSFNRWNTTLNNIFSRLSGVAGTGANAAIGMAGIGTGVAGQAGANTILGGQMQGAGQLGSANAFVNGLNGAIPTLQQMFTSQVPTPTPVNLGTATGADASVFW